MNKLFSKLFFLSFLVIFFSFGLSRISYAKAQEPNLISNPSVETAGTDPTSPKDWFMSQWGNNSATFNYIAGGAQDGNKSIYVSVSSRTSGDAKWYFNPVNVEKNTGYTYTDYYKGSVSSEVDIQYQDNSGNLSYVYLGTLKPSINWVQSSFSFTTPVNVSKLTIFHLLYTNGNLQTDNFSLMKIVQNTNNFVPNPSVEQPDPNNSKLPLNWGTESWGSNSATFSYLNSGFEGNRSVEVQVTKYKDGDAKWLFNPVDVKEGDYRFTDYYRSNVYTQVTVRMIANDGTQSYLGLDLADPSSTWKQYSKIFSVPKGIKQITIFQFLTSTGYLITDNYSITTYKPTGFNKAIVSLTFDNGFEDNYSTVLPVLNKYGFKSTQYISSIYPQQEPGQVFKIKAFYNNGSEIASHTVTHSDLTQMSQAQMINELTQSKSWLENNIANGTPVIDFATPFGAYNDNVTSTIKQYYLSNRNTDEGYNFKDNYNPYNILVQNILKTTTPAEVESWIQKAQSENAWLVIVYHRVADYNIQPYDTTTKYFNSEMSYISSSGITVETIKDALNETKNQI